MSCRCIIHRLGPQGAAVNQSCILLAVAAAAVCTGSTTAAQYKLTTLATFNGTNGGTPYAGLIADASGNLYGTTAFGGDLTLNNGSGDGTVFKVANDANHTLTTLAMFDGTNGYGPGGGLLADAGGNLYGTTQGGGALEGGAYGDGTVFELSPVPEPSSLLLAGLAGMALLGLFVERKSI
jgi:uncharacterized repeat protein (TIGR03803 family)